MITGDPISDLLGQSAAFGPVVFGCAVVGAVVGYKVYDLLGAIGGILLGVLIGGSIVSGLS